MTRPFRCFGIAVVAAALSLLPVPGLFGAPLRVVTWNLQPRDISGTDPLLLAAGVKIEAEQVLKDVKPDVIILQQVPDADTCDAVVQALRPAEFQVAVMSAVRDSQSGALLRQQTAILTRVRSSTASSDTWKTATETAGAPGGYVSTILHLDNRNVAVFGVQIGGIGSVIDVERDSPAQQIAREDAARQLVQQIDALRDSADPVQSVILAGDFNTTADDPKLSRELTLTRLERAGFANAFGDQPADKRVTLPGYGTQPDATVDYIFTRDARASGVRVVSVNTTLHHPVIADIDFGNATVAAAPVLPANLAPARPTAAPASATRSFFEQVGSQNLWWLSGLLAVGVSCIIAGILMLGRGGKSGHDSGQRETGPSSGGRSMLSPPNAGEILVVTRATQTGSALRASPVAEAAPVVHVQGSGVPRAEADAAEWRRRAEAAERRAARSAGALREGLLQQLTQWVKGGLVRRLADDRAELLRAQQEAALKMQSVDQRLTRVEIQIQQRMREYEHRITDLEKELAAAREENRELIRAKIAQVRAEMERERTRMLQDAQLG